VIDTGKRYRRTPIQEGTKKLRILYLEIGDSRDKLITREYSPETAQR